MEKNGTLPSNNSVDDEKTANKGSRKPTKMEIKKKGNWDPNWDH